MLTYCRQAKGARKRNHLVTKNIDTKKGTQERWTKKERMTSRGTKVDHGTKVDCTTIEVPWAGNDDTSM